MNAWIVSVVLATMVFSVSLWLAYAKRARKIHAVLQLICLTLFFGLGESNYFGDVFFEGDKPDIRAAHERVKRGIEFIKNNYRGGLPNFWLASLEGMDDEKWLFRSFYRCAVEPNYPESLPDPEVHWQQPISDADGLIVISDEPNLHPTARARLAEQGIEAEHYGSLKLRDGGVPYYILLLDLHRPL